MVQNTMPKGKKRNQRALYSNRPARNYTTSTRRRLGPVSDASSSCPVFILAPPRSFTSLVCSMIGQHPQLYGFPELQLFVCETMAEWQHRRTQTQAPFSAGDGLLRAVAQLCFGGQNEDHVRLASGWIRRRHHVTTGFMFELLTQLVHPLIPVEKSPSIVLRPTSLDRLCSMFPNARFLHLPRHPRGFGDSVIKAKNLAGAKLGLVPKWLVELTQDPQHSWYRLHKDILGFLHHIPESQKMRVRGEDILTDPDNWLLQIAGWLGVDKSAAAIEKMKHPERSPYACFGPPSARLGNDIYFLKDPALRMPYQFHLSLDGPVTWRKDEQGFVPAVQKLAREFGYS